MSRNISIQRTKQSSLDSLDFDNLPFGQVFSDHMFVADYVDGAWKDARIVPFGSFEMHPASMVLHYGQAVFEGMKASKSKDGRPMLFRPEQHAIRINKSANRLSMPSFPEDLFVEALHELVGLDADWIPPQAGSALYLRPFMFATDPFIGVRPSHTYRFIIFTCPVGPYYPKPVSLYADTTFVRAIKGGTGEAKAAGNYAAALLPAQKAQAKGFDQVMWLDGVEHKYIQEVGTMNIMFVIDGKIITPEPDGAILRGITKNSVLTILKDKGYEVEERPISIDEVIEAHQAGKLQEVFGTGTAAVVAHVSEIQYQDTNISLPPMEDRKIGSMIKSEIDGLRAGTVEDTRGWVIPVKAMIEA